MRLLPLLLISSIIIFSSCKKSEVTDRPSEDLSTLNLRVLNSSPSSNPISHLTILLTNENSIILKSYQYSEVVFDSNNEYRAIMSVPQTTRYITVLGNSLNSLVPSAPYEGLSLNQFYLRTSQAINKPITYFNAPAELYQGSSGVDFVSSNSIAIANVSLERVVSRLVVDLASSLDFMSNNGSGFNVSGSDEPMTISGIDSIFVLETPVGISLSNRVYYDPSAFGSAIIYRDTYFNRNNSGVYSDSILVFPQFGAQKLPYIVLSVRGSKGGRPFGGVNPPVYYGMRISSLALSGLAPNLTSLPSNVVVTMTVTSFQGSGSSMMPNPDSLATVEAIVRVGSWHGRYTGSGVME